MCQSKTTTRAIFAGLVAVLFAFAGLLIMAGGLRSASFSEYDKIQIGVTKWAEVKEKFGQPSEEIYLKEKKVLYYTRKTEKGIYKTFFEVDNDGTVIGKGKSFWKRRVQYQQKQKTY